MENIKNILVSLELEGQGYEVGEMVRDNRTIYFRYNAQNPVNPVRFFEICNSLVIRKSLLEIDKLR